MNEKFTPGPWEAINGSDVFTTLGATRRDGVIAEYNDGWHIADCAMGATLDSKGQSHLLELQEVIANAKLIAAAPEMYVELTKKCHNALDLGHCRKADCRNCQTMAVLKKARGKQ